MLGNLRHPWLWQVAGWALVAAVIFVCLLPGSDLPQLPTSDKVKHAFTYAVLALWFAGLYPRSRYVWIGVLLFILGVTIEWAQGVMALGRESELLDVVANTVGIVIGLTLAGLRFGDWVQRVEGWAKRS